MPEPIVNRRTFHEIFVSPLRTNVLDLIGREDLVTRLGSTVTVSRVGMGFRITYAVIDGAKWFDTDDNFDASYILNMTEGGVGVVS